MRVGDGRVVPTDTGTDMSSYRYARSFKSGISKLLSSQSSLFVISAVVDVLVQHLSFFVAIVVVVVAIVVVAVVLVVVVVMTTVDASRTHRQGSRSNHNLSKKTLKNKMKENHFNTTDNSFDLKEHCRKKET